MTIYDNTKKFFKGILFPGYLHDTSRVVYFLIFLILTIVQTYLSLQLEEQIAIDPKYIMTD